MFKITNCKESNIYIHDFHNTASVLNCEDCTIIMGPNSSSVFVRDCKNCKMVITAKQLRVRDCHGLRISLYTQTEPVIESSTGITIIPHQYVYEELFYQMKEAQLSFWNNKYTEVFDFTPSNTKVCNYNLEVSSKPYKQEVFVDLYSFNKIVEKAKKKQGIDHIDNLRDLEAIFGDDSFYKESD